jgi:fatty-acid desaturase
LLRSIDRQLDPDLLRVHTAWVMEQLGQQEQDMTTVVDDAELSRLARVAKLREGLVFVAIVAVAALAFSGVRWGGYLLAALLLAVPAGLVFIVFAAAVTNSLGAARVVVLKPPTAPPQDDAR